MNKKKTKKRIQKGGSWSDWFSNLSNKFKNVFSSGTNYAENSLNQITDKVTDLSNQTVNSISNIVSETSQPMPTQTIPTQTMPTQTMPNQTMPNQTITGGKKIKRKKYKGGNLGLTYYATDVSGLQVAKPTYWIKGGTKKRRNTRRKGNRSRRK